MKRSRFLQIGGLMAAAAAQFDSFAGIPDKKRPDDKSRRVDFIKDGVELSPAEYASLLMRLVDEGKIRIDDYSRGGVVEELEHKFATLLGKESAVFMPTGTLANHIAVRRLASLNRRVIVQEQSHLYNDCGDCAQTLSGLNLIPIGENAVDFSVEDVTKVLNRAKTGRVETRIGVISIETPVRRKQDCVFGFEKIKSVVDYARNNGISTHLDGARLFVQSVHEGVDPEKFGELFDTVYTSLYKCFNAPSGAILAGSKKFTDSLFHERRMFGGGLSESWPFAAIALHYADGFLADYGNAWMNARKFLALLGKNERIKVTELENGTHIVRLDVGVKDLVRFRDFLARNNVMLNPPGKSGFALKINPTLNRMQPEAMARLFTDALKAGG